MVKSVLLLFLLCGFVACKPASPVAPRVAATPTPPLPQLAFKAYDGDPRKTDPKKMSFQIAWLDRHEPSEFLSLGQFVPNTRFRLTDFQFKTRQNPQNGETEDASELTLVNVDTNQVMVLTLKGVKDSPPVF